ncbi:MAG: methionine synthase [Herpetosiphon sp.]
MPHASPYLAELDRRVLVFDGAMGTSLDLFKLTPADFGGDATDGARDYLVLTRPDIITQVHTSFMEAGCDVLETNTFQSSRLRLEEWGLGEKTYEVNHTAAQLARKVADQFQARDGRRRFVAGSIGPTGKLPSSEDPVLSKTNFTELSDTVYEQARALVEGGVDLLLIETAFDVIEVKAGLDGIRRYLTDAKRNDIAVQVQFFLDVSGRTLLGSDIGAVLATFEALSVVDVIGLNCSTGPDLMRDPIRELCNRTRLKVSCIPNAGLPQNVDGNAVYSLGPEPYTKTMLEFVDELGVNVVGGCCGTTPAHIKRLIDALGVDHAPKQRAVESVPMVASGMRPVAISQKPALMMIGERLNSTGSRKVKRLLLDDNYDGLLEVAHEQQDAGAHMLDVGVAMTERSDEREQMETLVKKLRGAIELPLVFDSTEPDILKAALEIYPGRPILNSVSLEGGRGQKIDWVLPLVARYGAATIALTIDEDGMARTADKKLEIARRMADIAREEYGLTNDVFLFDVLCLPISTGQAEERRNAIETLEGIRLVKQHIPGCFTVLGVSNLSFGLAINARAALNSVFLKHAVDAGLDAAIINPAHVTAYADIPQEERELCEALIFDRSEDALTRMIQFYSTGSSADVQRDQKTDPTAGMSVDQRLHWKILHRKKDGVESDIDEALANRMSTGAAQGPAAVEILNNALLPAMKEVGDRFGAGELILPFVLQSAEVMKKTVAHLEQYLDRVEGTSKGKVVLATVYGDVHDIGKNLVNTILSNNGYTVYDLGKQVPINTIIAKAEEVGADAIGLSALLVSTSKQMPLCVQELHKRGLSYPVLVGGAAINRQYGQRILFVGEGQPYEPGVFYCKDAFEGLETMDRLSNPEHRAAFVARTQEEALIGAARPERGRTVLEKVGRTTADGVRSRVRRDVDIPSPPFWGARSTTKIRLEDLWQCMDLNTLFRLQWGAKNAKGAEYQRLIEEEFMPQLRKLQRDAKEHGWLQPAVTYGFFPVQSAGQDLIVYQPADHTKELTRFIFPRQPARERLCIADYFADVESGRMDVAAFQVVTMGQRATEYIDELQAAGDYHRSYLSHGLGVTAAEGLAEWSNRIICKALGIEAPRGKRYSWGYPACPDLDEHEKLFHILPTEEIGVQLTSAYQLVPEQSTAAIVVHHPQATYFSIAGSLAERSEADAA